ncbi:MAG: AAA family ATPase, partial [Planctomycetota bacterium]
MIRPAMSAPFVLVSGGKGGVGKTMVAVNLAVQLASEGRRVLLADLDLAMADAHVLVRLSPSSTIGDFLAGRVSARDCIVCAAGGFDLLPAESGDPTLARDDAARREAILAALADLSVDYDIVLGDSAAGVGPDVLDFAAAADRVLIVTTPDPTALTDAYGCIKALDLHAAELGIDLPTPE